MLFSSALFLFLALPLVVLVYHLLPHLLRNAWLLVASLVLYAWGEPKLLWVMLASMAGNYLAGLAMGRLRSGRWARPWLFAVVATNLLALGWFKYAGWLAATAGGLLGSDWRLAEIALPLGISFYTFHALSYVVDVYRGDAPVQRDPAKIALYLTLYPQLIAGPILRYHHMQDQLGRRPVGIDDFAYGVQRFAIGLGKKVLIANPLAKPADALFAVPADDLGAPAAWLAVIAYTGQIYFDFSGYSDMAVGLARMHGFVFVENFQWPYSARSIVEFWRRWHMSLSNWFRDYLYIPLGGNRGSPWVTRRNLVLVFLLCGLWHGANWTFVVWGIWHGAFLALERGRLGGWVKAAPRPAQHLYTMAVVVIGWVLFRADSLGHAAAVVRAMLGLSPGDTLRYPLAMHVGRDTALALAVGLVLSQPVAPWLGARWQAWRTGTRSLVGRVADGAAQGALVLGVLAILVGSGVLLAAATHNPFIYFRF